MKSGAAFERPAAFVIELFNGHAHVCQSLDEAFRFLRGDAWACADQSKRAYMAGVARRARDWNKAIVRVDSVENFLYDLEAAGHITIRPLQ